MKFDDAFIATGIGSFPHKGKKEVFDLVLQNFPEIPFWPQLPKRSFLEGMVVQYSEGFPSFRLNEKEQRAWVDTSHGFEKEVERFYGWLEKEELGPFRMTEDFARGLGLLKDLTSEDHRKKIKYIKGQITGPITFGLCLSDQERKPIFYDPTLRDILIKHLSSKARWMEKRFNDLFPGIPTMISFDEPSLSSFGSAFSSLSREDVIFSLNECFDAVKGLKGSSLLRKYGLGCSSFDRPRYPQFRCLRLPGDALPLSEGVESIPGERGHPGLGHCPNERSHLKGGHPESHRALQRRVKDSFEQRNRSKPSSKSHPHAELRDRLPSHPFGRDGLSVDSRRFKETAGRLNRDVAQILPDG